LTHFRFSSAGDVTFRGRVLSVTLWRRGVRDVNRHMVGFAVTYIPKKVSNVNSWQSAISVALFPFPVYHTCNPVVPFCRVPL